MIENIYQDFAVLIGDPFLFDAVLDLYDTFATLHKLLTEDLPAVRKEEPTNSDIDRLGYLDEDRVRQLSMLVEAVDNALQHRVAKSYPEVQIREIATDFRGGLNQILLAADAPVKCGLGLVRIFGMMGSCGTDTENRRRRRDTVGCVTRVGFMPGAKCYSLVFGAENRAKLAYFEVDIAHVLHIASHCDSLHESFHVVFDVLCQMDAKNAKVLRCLEPVMADRVGEVFAGILSQAFVFGRDVDTFLYHHLCSYSKNVTSVGRDDTEVVARVTEMLIRLFFVRDAIPAGVAPCKWGEDWVRKGDSTQSALVRFEKMVDEFGMFFSEYHRLWNGKNSRDIRDYARKQFEHIYPTMAERMPWVWSLAIDIYKRFFKYTFCVGTAKDYSGVWEEVERAIKQGLEEGKPLIRSLYGDVPDLVEANSKHDAGRGSEYAGLDNLFLVCKLLCRYIQKIGKIGQARGKAIHLRRGANNRRVEYPELEGGEKWHDFQFDKGATSMFCPVPSARRERLKKQIVILKTFWDISSCLRARRLCEIMADNELA